jgi:hypothetical protein
VKKGEGSARSPEGRRRCKNGRRHRNRRGTRRAGDEEEGVVVDSSRLRASQPDSLRQEGDGDAALLGAASARGGVDGNVGNGSVSAGGHGSVRLFSVSLREAEEEGKRGKVETPRRLARGERKGEEREERVGEDNGVVPARTHAPPCRSHASEEDVVGPKRRRRREERKGTG